MTWREFDPSIIERDRKHRGRWTVGAIVLVVGVLAVGAAFAWVDRQQDQDWTSMHREIAGIQVDGLRWTGEQGESRVCTSSGKSGDSKNMFVKRTYVLDGVTFDEAADRVERHLRSIGYAPDPGITDEVPFRFGHKDHISYAVNAGPEPHDPDDGPPTELIVTLTGCV